MTNSVENQLAPATFQFGTLPLTVFTDEAGVPWFNANEVCGALGFGNSRQALRSHVHVDDVQNLDTIDSLGRTQQANHINESGLYTLIFGSKKEEAKKFKHWVTSEVLPAIRKTGSFVLAQAVDKAVAQTEHRMKLEYSAEASAIRGTSPTYDIGRKLIQSSKKCKPGKPWPPEVVEVIQMARRQAAELQRLLESFDPDSVVDFEDDHAYANIEFEIKNAHRLQVSREGTPRLKH